MTDLVYHASFLCSTKQIVGDGMTQAALQEHIDDLLAGARERLTAQAVHLAITNGWKDKKDPKRFKIEITAVLE